jgi:hypothetical protein
MAEVKQVILARTCIFMSGLCVGVAIMCWSIGLNKVATINSLAALIISLLGYKVESNLRGKE